MSLRCCPFCDSTRHITGYGLAAGCMGSYTFCDDCDELIEFAPEMEGLPEDIATERQKIYDRWKKKFDARVATRLAEKKK